MWSKIILGAACAAFSGSLARAPSIVFVTRKVHRRIGGNFTFLILTDRDDLDTHIYNAFAGCRVVLNRLQWQIAELRANLDKIAVANAAMAAALN